MTADLTSPIALHTQLPASGITAVLQLLEEGATIPFIARYRKERTGSLDEEQIERIRDVAVQLTALNKRRDSILASLRERELLTAELEGALTVAGTMAELEDLYLPHRPRRRTRAQVAREAGYEPLAEKILARGDDDPYQLAATQPDPAGALAGAGDIIAEKLSEVAALRGALRELFRRRGVLSSARTTGKSAPEDPTETYRDYYEWSELARRAPSHRVLAVLRGGREKILSVHALPDEEAAMEEVYRSGVAALEVRTGPPPAGRRRFMEAVARDAYRRLLAPSLETELIHELRTQAEETAAAIFSRNLRDLLMAPPLGQVPLLAVDPGFRTGCKVVCLDAQGSLLHHTTIYPLPPREETTKAAETVRHLISTWGLKAVAVGNGTGGREAEGFLIDAVAEGADGTRIPVIMVNEAGASVYSASKVARLEFPDQDVTVRGAISIGRRLMDPLAELVKIDPAAIGVGQYQHDLDQKLLAGRLADTVRSCVNAVGAEVNTASAELLQYVSGLSAANARAIVGYREKHGPYRNRNTLSSVPGIGAVTFQQAAGFLRVRGGEHPLDSSGIHPERYPLVEQIAADLGAAVGDLPGNHGLCGAIELRRYCTDEVGIPTLEDIRAELLRPGRDPRESFELFTFDENVHTIDDLTVGMILPGRVTNVTAFGAFVDVGVHRDGLVHVSKIEGALRVQQTVRVQVLDVDRVRNRISLDLARDG